MANFFINRPIFAWVIAIVIMLAGALSIISLPVAQYPSIAPPTIGVTAVYPGASAKTVEDAVTQVIEQRMTGLDGLLYMSSNSDSYGNASVTLTFDAGTDPNIAQVQVQNKLQLALPLLPQEVQQQGVSVNKTTRNFLRIYGFYSEDGSLGRVDIADFLASNIADPISRVEGVGEITVFGAKYSMRVWLDPDKMVQYRITTGDVQAAIRAQNAQVSAGQLGGTPAVPGQGFQASITAQSRLQTPEQFEQILLRTSQQGGEVRLRDVARIEIGAENYGVEARLNGKPASGLGIKLAAGANALGTAKAVEAKLESLKPYFPPGVKMLIPYDTTPFVKLSIEEVIKTLFEAIVLVFLVMYLFLQNFRATLIPTIAVPVVLLGTFAVLAAAGFTINTLTMFAMVLAIGLLVDDAIVVVENVERVMTEEGLSPKEATKRSMGQITGALIGIGMILASVFVPMAFFGGSTGVIYRQFSITIVAAMAFSVLVAIIFTPALCATMIKPVEKGHAHGEGSLFGKFFTWFNRFFDRSTAQYESVVARFLKRTGRIMVIYLALAGVMGYLLVRLPTAFLPDEDQGVLFTQVILPAGATQERTLEVMRKLEGHFLEGEKENVNTLFTIAGFSFAGSGQNMGLGFVNLKPWDDRPDKEEQSVWAIRDRAMGFFSQIREAMVFAFAPPAVIELGNATGFDLQLQDRGGVGHEALIAARNQFLMMASQDKRLVGVRPNGQEDVAEYQLQIDHAKATALGVSIAEINQTLQTAWGASYINDFLDRGRVKRVYVQADAAARMNPEDLKKWHVRNQKGEMVPLSAFVTAKWAFGSPRLERFNGVPSVQLLGQPARGLSSGDAMTAVEEIIAKLPPGIGYEWSGTSFEERRSGAQAPALYALSMLIVFLCLAALYESWTVPFSVLLIVPIGALGAALAASLFGFANDVYFQLALLTTVGLSSKNAILIVEFAKANIEQEGKPLMEATLQAVRMRLRPIIMTSMAFGLGVLPLAIADGAGSASQNAIGSSVLGGTLAGTFIGIFFIPVFYVVVMQLFASKKAKALP